MGGNDEDTLRVSQLPASKETGMCAQDAYRKSCLGGSEK